MAKGQKKTEHQITAQAFQEWLEANPKATPNKIFRNFDCIADEVHGRFSVKKARPINKKLVSRV